MKKINKIQNSMNEFEKFYELLMIQILKKFDKFIELLVV